MTDRTLWQRLTNHPTTPPAETAEPAVDPELQEIEDLMASIINDAAPEPESAAEPPAKPRRPVRRREDLPPMLRAVSDTLDHHNHAMHGLTSGWAHPAEFLEVLEENGHTVVGADELANIRAALTTPDAAVYNLVRAAARNETTRAWLASKGLVVMDQATYDRNLADIRRLRGEAELRAAQAEAALALAEPRERAEIFRALLGGMSAAEEMPSPVVWEAIARMRERELRTVGEARHQAVAAIARARRLAEQWSAWTPQDGDRGTLATAGRALATALDPPPPGEFSVEVMTSWAPYAPEIVAEMTGGDETELRNLYGDTINVRMGFNGPVELRWGGPGPDPAEVEETRHIIRDHILWADRARGSARMIPSLTLSQQGLTPTLRADPSPADALNSTADGPWLFELYNAAGALVEHTFCSEQWNAMAAASYHARALHPVTWKIVVTSPGKSAETYTTAEGVMAACRALMAQHAATDGATP